MSVVIPPDWLSLKMPSKNLATPPPAWVISTTPLRVSTSAPFLTSERSSGMNFFAPGTLISTVPLIGFATTLLLRTGVGVAVGVGVGVGVTTGVAVGVGVGVGDGAWYS